MESFVLANTFTRKGCRLPVPGTGKAVGLPLPGVRDLDDEPDLLVIRNSRKGRKVAAWLPRLLAALADGRARSTRDLEVLTGGSHESLHRALIQGVDCGCLTRNKRKLAPHGQMVWHYTITAVGRKAAG